ncbi:hypothetical protein FS935_22385 [Metabacillus litoralis]|uniref:Bacterial Ig domain-containing protein n=1 Tax=Metabacillus litoralis TaxID=152268 RepID=A0A5C6UZ95_9BACI|nr:Ig-like domain-containing protein [Metabacillus litoralis]TXC78763.1 hypothetical protein FS935_22385 [Metabacillus litoralis]
MWKKWGLFLTSITLISSLTIIPFNLNNSFAAEVESEDLREFDFIDLDPNRGEYGGTIIWQGPDKSDGVDHYVLEGEIKGEHGNAEEFIIAKIPANDLSSYAFQFAENTTFNGKLTQLELSAEDENGYFITGMWLNPIDNISAEKIEKTSLPTSPKVSAITTDLDKDEYIVNFTDIYNEDAVEGYVLYYLDKNSEKIKQIGELNKSLYSSNSVWLNRNDIPSSAISIGIYPRTAEGEGNPGISRLWKNNIHTPHTVEFNDTDSRYGSISGVVNFKGARDETEDILGYEVGFITDDGFSKLGDVEKRGSNSSYQFAVSESTSVPFSAYAIAVRIKQKYLNEPYYAMDYLKESEYMGMNSPEISEDDVNIFSKNLGEEKYIKIKHVKFNDIIKLYNDHNQLISSYKIEHDREAYRISLDDNEGSISITRTRKGYQESKPTSLSYKLPNDIQTAELYTSTPILIDFAQKDTELKGNAAPLAEIILKANGVEVGKTISDENGYFMIPVNEEISGLISVTQKIAGMKSETYYIVEDKAPPTFTLNDQVTNDYPFINGKTKKYAMVTISNKAGVIVTKQAKFDGRFYAELPSNYEYKEFYVSVIDASGQASEEYTFNFHDVRAPQKPILNEVTDKSTTVSGETEANAFVNIGYNSSVKSIQANHEGLFTLPITKLKAGTEVIVTATDQAGNVSDQTKLIVKDVTAPAAPTVNEITDQSVIVKGKSEPNAIITLVYNGLTKTINADKDGLFSLSIKKQKAGVTFTVKATDNAGNTSIETKLSVKDKTPPNLPTVKTISNISTVIEGTAEVGSTVTVNAGKTLLGTATVNSKGKYSIKISKKQKATTSISLFATDKAGNKSKTLTTTVIDKLAPSVPTANKITSKTTTVTGKAEANSIVTITNSSKKLLGKATTDKKGNYKVKISKQKKGTTITIWATDKAGNKSKGKGVKIG